MRRIFSSDEIQFIYSFMISACFSCLQNLYYKLQKDSLIFSSGSAIVLTFMFGSKNDRSQHFNFKRVCFCYSLMWYISHIFLFYDFILYVYILYIFKYSLLYISNISINGNMLLHCMYHGEYWWYVCMCICVCMSVCLCTYIVS